MLLFWYRVQREVGIWFNVAVNGRVAGKVAGILWLVVMLTVRCCSSCCCLCRVGYTGRQVVSKNEVSEVALYLLRNKVLLAPLDHHVLTFLFI